MIDICIEKEELYFIFQLLLSETKFPARVLLDIVFDTVNDDDLVYLLDKVIKLTNNKRSNYDNEIQNIKK